MIVAILGVASIAHAARPDVRFEADGHVLTGDPVGPTGWKIRVVEKRRSKEVFSATIPDVLLSRDYHPIEFRNGRLYVVRRTGGAEGYRTHPDTWTDELWRYEGSRGTRLFAARGLHYRVPPGDGFIAVTDGSDEQARLTLLTSAGAPMRTYGAADLGLEWVGYFWVTDHDVYVSLGGPQPGLARLVRIGVRDSSLKTYDFADLDIDGDYDFDPRTLMIVGSDCPGFVDAEDHDAWASQHPVVTLFIYDLSSATRTMVMTSVAQYFDPRWIGDGVFEFTDPGTGKRATRSVRSVIDRPR